MPLYRGGGIASVAMLTGNIARSSALVIIWVETGVAEVARSILGLRAAKVLVAPEL
jgi:hypothetical protein